MKKALPRLLAHSYKIERRKSCDEKRFCLQYRRRGRHDLVVDRDGGLAAGGPD